MTREAIIAPHLDDAVLSAWHQIEHAESQTVTIFAGIPDQSDPSWWDRLTAQTNAQEVMQSRRAENGKALANTPTLITNLDFLDRPYVNGARNIETIADVVEASVQSRVSFVVAAGIGTFLRQHPDHKSTRQVGVQLRERGHNVAFYADIPYALPFKNFDGWPNRLPAEKLKRLLDSDIEIETIELSEAEQKRKQAAVLAFETQFKMVNMLALGALRKTTAYKWEALIHCV